MMSNLFLFSLGNSKVDTCFYLPNFTVVTIEDMGDKGDTKGFIQSQEFALKK